MVEFKHKTHREARGKTFFIFGVLVLTWILSINLVSAQMEYDNTKSFDNKIGDYGKVIIEDWFGLQQLTELELKENTEQCSLGRFCYMETEIVLHQETVLIDSVRFMDGNNPANIRGHTFYLVEGHEKVVYNLGTTLKAGTYLVRLEGEKKRNQEVDWQITSQGQLIDEWAIWEATDGIIAYYDMDEGTGTTVGDSTPNGRDGTFNLPLWDSKFKLGTNSAAFNGAGAGGGGNEINITPRVPMESNGTWSISTWVFLNETKAGSERQIFTTQNKSGFDNNNARFFVVDSGSGLHWSLRMKHSTGQLFTWTNNKVIIDSWQHLVLTYNGSTNASGVIIYVNGTSVGGMNIDADTLDTNFTFWDTFIGGGGGVNTFNGSIDEFGIWNVTLSASEVSDLYNNGAGLSFGTQPSIIIQNSPDDNINITRQDVIFNCSIISDNPKNLSLWHNASGEFIINQTNSTLDNTNTTTFTASMTDPTLWGCQACEDNENCEFSVNRTINALGWVERSQTFSTTTTEGNVAEFIINVSLSPGTQISIGFLNYNNTRNIGTISNTGGNNFSITRNLNIPSIETNTNFTFFWEIELNDGYNENSTFNNQSVNALGIDDCSIFTTILLNYTLRDEETQERLDSTRFNTTIELDVDIYPQGSRVPIIEFSANYSENNATVCLDGDLVGVTYELDVLARYGGDSYAKEFHNIQNSTITNSSLPININLFDLKDIDSTRFLITFKNSNFLAVDNALIDIQRKYVSEGVFKSVEIPKTDQDGQAIGHFDLEGVLYTFIVTKNGVVLATFDNVAVICQDVIIGDCSINLNALGTSESFRDWETLGGITYIMNFNSTQRRITTIFTTTDGSTKTIFMNTTRQDRFGNTTICTDSLMSSSGTLTCDIDSSFGNITMITRLFSDNVLITQRTFRIIVDPQEIFGESAAILVLILVITIPLMLVSSTIGVVVGVIIGLVMATMLTLFSAGEWFGIGSSIMWLVIAGAIIIYKISNRGG